MISTPPAAGRCRSRCSSCPTSQPLASAGRGRGRRASGPAPGAAGIGDPYFPLDGNGGIDVLHYDIHDTLPLRRRAACAAGPGSRLRATQDLSRFDLDFLLPVQPGDRGRPRARSTTRRPAPRARHHARSRRCRRASRSASWSGTPAARRATATAARATGWPNDHEVVTMNEPHMAPWWFPANDHPRDKAPGRHHDHGAARQAGRRQRPPGLARKRHGDQRDVPLARRRADGAVPRVLRGRPLRDLARARSDGLPWLRRRLQAAAAVGAAGPRWS